jgi:hypothetical protein
MNPAIGHWDGTSWSIGTVPSPNGSALALLTGVSCLSASSCVAVGSYETNPGERALIERWDGTAWTLVASPNPGASAGLSAVSCPSPSECFAVGSSSNGSVGTTLIERWNGTAWTVVASPNAGSDPNSGLFAISCATVTMCFAVGSSNHPGPTSYDVYNPLIERWNGTSWSLAATPFPVNNGSHGVTDIACPTATMCLAVALGSSALIGRWNGGSWSLVNSATPADAAGATIDAIACTSASNCFGVGYYYKPHVTYYGGEYSQWTLAERYG